MTGLGLAVLGLLSQVTSATIDANIETGTIDARYTLSTASDSVVMRAYRPAAGVLRLFDSTGFQSLDGMYVLTVPATPGGRFEVSFRYEVSPRNSRMPVFVPDVPAIPGSDIRIRIIGVSDDARLTDGFPRLSRGAGGDVVATPANLPSFIVVPPTASVSVNWIADMSVIALLVLSTGLFLARGRAR